jgi:predicted nuclease with TOPRIM domain
MSVDERRRLELADAAKRALGDDAGITLMEMLPSVGWADVATKQDLVVLRGDLELVRDDVGRVRGEVNELRGEVRELRGEFGEMQSDFDKLRGEFKELRSDLDVRLERGFRQILVTVSSLLIGGFLVAIFAVVAAALIR